MKTYPTLIPLSGYSKIVEMERPDLDDPELFAPITMEQCFAANYKLHAKLKLATDALTEIMTPKKREFFLDGQLQAAIRLAEQALAEINKETP